MIGTIKLIFTSTGFNHAIPYIVVAVGLFFFCFGTFYDFNSEHKNLGVFFAGLGKTMLAGGVFAFILKTQQLLGVYKDELTKIIFEPKFLKNRHDLAEFWEKTTVELFKNKFPGINKRITNDVKEIYLPTKSVQYYDNLKLYYEITLIDADKDLVEVTQTSKFTIIPVDKERFTHTFENNIHTGGKIEDYQYELIKFKVNEIEQKIDLIEKVFDSYTTTKYDVVLQGKDGYNIEFMARKRYSLKHDFIIGNVSTYIRNNFTVQLQFQGVDVTFLEVGTLNKFKTNVNNASLLTKEYQGILYPKQGFLAILKKK